jgi:hypothetical protein
MKGALVAFTPTFLPVPVPDVIVFQYNPETMMHTWVQEQPERMPGEETSNPLAVNGMPGETFSFTLAMNSNEEIADGSPPAAAIAQASGIYSRLAALELLLYPTQASNTLLGTVSAAITSALSGASTGVTRTVPEAVLPLTLFIWGPGRIVPVRITDLTITEQLYDAALNPTYVEANVSLRVLTPAELAAVSADNDVLASLATVAYDYTLTLRRTLATANLANAAESIIGLIPH